MWQNVEQFKGYEFHEPLHIVYRFSIPDESTQIHAGEKQWVQLGC